MYVYIYIYIYIYIYLCIAYIYIYKVLTLSRFHSKLFFGSTKHMQYPYIIFYTFFHNGFCLDDRENFLVSLIQPCFYAENCLIKLASEN